MTDRYKPLLDREFLRGELHRDYLNFEIRDDALLKRLTHWHASEVKREKQAEDSFTQRFFVETWGYRQTGTGGEFELLPKLMIPGTGAGGRAGEADLVVGLFGGDRLPIPQVVCEYKGVGTNLDAPQPRKGNTRSPVQQAADYLRGAARGVFPGAPVQPRWALVTDMNEFRLYWGSGEPDRFLRFTIGQTDLFSGTTLLGTSERARFDRFLFWRLFQGDMLLADGGRPRLERLIEKQGNVSKKLEGRFYEDYRLYRKLLIDNINAHPPEGVTPGGAIRLAQKLLDRLIFIMFAEDMGGRVGFPAGELTTQLKRFAEDRFLEPNRYEVWDRLTLIFERMNEGGQLGPESIHQFNGGLFAPDDQLDALRLPNHVFVRYGQAQNNAAAAEQKATLYWLASEYNYAAEGDADNAIGLYTLGHIFEQSIVELEALEAEVEGHETLATVSERKRDGVYYTPEWVVRRIVEEVLDPLFARWREEAGGDPNAYWGRLRQIRIVDPACGSGAFLITALRHLRPEFERAAAEAGESRTTINGLTESILANNLFGVDINPSSVEITRLSLWLHTARPGTPLSSLDDTIRCGNSLVGTAFDTTELAPELSERINCFDWDGKLADPFDAVVGNPPYVKLQNFVKVYPEVAAWLQSPAAPYRSTQTGNFDLFLPFIERGLQLLAPGGRMGYIAPSLWPTLEYGKGLRPLVAEGQHLERWLDFRSFQVFEEATVYTAIQIFARDPAPVISLAAAPDGNLAQVDWTSPDAALPYAEITAPAEPWLLAPTPVRRLIERLGRDGRRLDDPMVSSAIFQGIITSADHIYHLRRIANGLYEHTPREKRLIKGKLKTIRLPPIEVRLEDALMKPLVSGAEAKRFTLPQTETYLLFPYDTEDGGAELITAERMEREFPNAWRYLRSYEKELRGREKGKFDDIDWYRMGRNQNLDKQELPKVIVPRLVARLQASADESGQFYCDNVDVGGIICAAEDVIFLTGLLNSPLAAFIFSWRSKPFRGAYYSANKQFIAPLPIPQVSSDEQKDFSLLSRRMQADTTERAQVIADLANRLGRVSRKRLPLEWLLPDVRSVAQLEEELWTSPYKAKTREEKRGLKERVDEQRELDEDAALQAVARRLAPAAILDAYIERGELRFTADGAVVAQAIVAPDEELLLLAQWQAIAHDFDAAQKNAPQKLINRLRSVARMADPAIRDQIIALAATLATLTVRIRADEATLHDLTCRLCALTPEERALVEAGR